MYLREIALSAYLEMKDKFDVDTEWLCDRFKLVNQL